MDKLYLFAVGGTGARVLRSLVMLLASGVDIGAKMVVPIIMDPHADNDDVKRTIECLRAYCAINKSLGSDNKGFFKTPIKTLKELNDDSAATDTVVFELNDVDQQRFSDYIQYGELENADKAMIDLLFSGELQKPGETIQKRNTNMDEGFYGNPDLGSVVLNQFADTEDYDSFATSYNEGDGIMIIGSIFGGTGAAGLPVILNNVRNSLNTGHPNGAVLSNAIIGSMIVLPYFSIKNDDSSSIREGDFYVKTRSALSYYYENVSNPNLNKINATYYIGDHGGTDGAYKNDPGAGGQKNDAHFTELAAASGVLDFCALQGMKCSDGKPDGTVYFREFGIDEDNRAVGVTHFGPNTKRAIGPQLSQLKLFQIYVDKKMSDSVGNQAWSTAGTPKISTPFLSTELVNIHLRDFLGHFKDWEVEISRNRRGLELFTGTDDLSRLFRGVSTTKDWVGMSNKVNLYHIDHEMNVVSDKNDNYPNESHKFFDIIYVATENVLKTNYEVFENIID